MIEESRTINELVQDMAEDLNGMLSVFNPLMFVTGSEQKSSSWLWGKPEIFIIVDHVSAELFLGDTADYMDVDYNGNLTTLSNLGNHVMTMNSKISMSDDPSNIEWSDDDLVCIDGIKQQRNFK